MALGKAAPAQWAFRPDQLVLKGDEMATETKVILGGLLIAAGYYWASSQRFRGGLFAGRNLIPDLLTMAGGVVVAGAVRDMFWPTYKPVPAEFMKQFQF